MLPMLHVHSHLVSVFRRTEGKTWEPQKKAKLFRIFGS